MLELAVFAVFTAEHLKVLLDIVAGGIQLQGFNVRPLSLGRLVPPMVQHTCNYINISIGNLPVISIDLHVTSLC